MRYSNVQPPALLNCGEEDRHDVKELIPNEYASYCKEGRRFYRACCVRCEKQFVEKYEKENKATTFRPTSKNPMYMCNHKYCNCTYAVCVDCYRQMVVTPK